MVIKIGAKVVHHARYVTFQAAEVALPCWLDRAILDRMPQVPPERSGLGGRKRLAPSILPAATGQGVVTPP